VKNSRQSPIFGKRKEPHTVIIAHGDKVHHFTIRPWLAAAAGSVVAAISIGYVLATSYLVLRDDLIGATVARQARMQQAYEDRISALRAQVDRITSRQLLDQQLMETKVTQLLARQSELAQRQAKIAPILGETVEQPAASKPLLRTELAPGQTFASMDITGSIRGGSSTTANDGSAADHADRLFVSINKSLNSIEQDQMTRLRTLTEDAYETADAIKDALKIAGLNLSIDTNKDAVGGPLVPLDASSHFDSAVEDLDDALSMLGAVKGKARGFPILNPAPGKDISSTFGPRSDPFLGTSAMHAGLDFRAAAGTPIRAGGGGTVVAAGWNGGYGKMVEIDHGNGLHTRYAHMSAIAVDKGDKIKAGDVVGQVGSTGRSTGPHLHYEVRRDGAAINPYKFIKAGQAIAKLL